MMNECRLTMFSRVVEEVEGDEKHELHRHFGSIDTIDQEDIIPKGGNKGIGVDIEGAGDAF